MLFQHDSDLVFLLERDFGVNSLLGSNKAPSYPTTVLGKKFTHTACVLFPTFQLRGNNQLSVARFYD